MTVSNRSLRWPAITSRVLAGIFGSYAFTWGFVAAAVAALVGLGVAYEEAEQGVHICALIIFPCLFLWAFAARNAMVLWVFLAGGTGVFFAAAWLIQRAILA